MTNNKSIYCISRGITETFFDELYTRMYCVTVDKFPVDGDWDEGDDMEWKIIFDSDVKVHWYADQMTRHAIDNGIRDMSQYTPDGGRKIFDEVFDRIIRRATSDWHYSYCLDKTGTENRHVLDKTVLHAYLEAVEQTLKDM